jgi:hypothetical protein
MALDRKELARQYKETPRTMGVGAVRNLTTGKLLVFSGADLPSLLNRHRAQLRLGAHPNRSLQDDWNSLGVSAFGFETLDTLQPAETPDYDPADDLRALEDLWLEKLAPFEPAGYNRRPKSSTA